ncbi:hypothetical protein DD595_25635, partial [Enterobacter cloacae complex sp. 4DZ3-17B2]|uniref:hypothetical protein n=1 Tax=Enterobacter cloacae complex sp. 4DZ3-17B2 TaxID=2511990 RepID=UPI001025B040
MSNVQERVRFLNEVMNKSDILKLPENQTQKNLVFPNLLKEMGLLVQPSQMQEVCDTVGVSRRGYRAISKTWFQVLKYYKIKAFGLPRPDNVGKVRTLLNEEIPEYFGEYYHIEGTMPYVKQKKKSSFEYNVFNNIWMS